MKLAALDLGSNSFLCLICEARNGKIEKILSDQVEIVRLGQGVDQARRLHPDALNRAELCLKMFSSTIESYGVDGVLAMATSAARDSENREELISIGRKLNIPIEIIPGSEEARITFSGSTSGIQSWAGPCLVIDIGGSSTELIVGDRNGILFKRSLDIGVVRLSERHISHHPVSDQERSFLIEKIELELESTINEISRLPYTSVIAVAGTPTTLAAAALGGFDPDKIDSYMFDLNSLGDWCNKLQSASVEERIDKYKIPKGRADVIFAGAQILYCILKLSQRKNLSVSTRGVRFGVALELLARLERGVPNE